MKETALGILIIPAIALSLVIMPAPIVNRTHVIPATGAGWLEQTGWVYDDSYRVVLGGHTPGDFARLDELQPGDVIVVIGDRGRVRYEVTELLYVDASDWRYMVSTSGHMLTLITCTEDSTVRLIVNARRIDTD